jgi:large subunit ribosomal protein L17
MRHRKSGIKLNRSASHRKAMFRNMVTSLFKNDRIQTTDAKAKELRGWADHLISLAKRGDLHARRQALSIIREKDVVHRLFENAPKRFGSRTGGYTRIVKLGPRQGDAAPMSLIELITEEAKTAKSKKKKTSRKAAKTPAAEKKTKKEDKPAKPEAKAAAAEEPQAPSEAAEDQAPKADSSEADAAEASAEVEEPSEPAEEDDGQEAAQAPPEKDKDK